MAFDDKLEAYDQGGGSYAESQPYSIDAHFQHEGQPKSQRYTNHIVANEGPNRAPNLDA